MPYTPPRLRSDLAKDPAPPPYTLKRTVALVGMMGAGKSVIGRRLARVLHANFEDSDTHIERAANMTISEIFAKYGAEDFRAGERKVAARLLNGPPHILATGGGTFIDEKTRGLIKTKAISIWIKVELDELVYRVKKNLSKRPLLTAGKNIAPKDVDKNIHAILQKLLHERAPVYAKANHVVIGRRNNHAEVIEEILAHLASENSNNR